MSKVLEILGDRLENEGLEVKYGESAENNEMTVNTVIDGLGEDEEGAVVCQISKLAEDEDGSEYYSFFTIVAENLEESVFPSTLLNLNELNAGLMTGAYGILSEDGTVYHKYVYRLSKQDDDKGAESLYGVFVDTVATLYNDYDEIFAGITE